MSDTLTIPRKELVRTIGEAIPEHLGDLQRAALLRVAATTTAIAVGTYCHRQGGVGCPLEQAGLVDTAFSRAYDRAMQRRFPDGGQGYPYGQFVVTVEPESESA